MILVYPQEIPPRMRRSHSFYSSVFSRAVASVRLMPSSAPSSSTPCTNWKHQISPHSSAMIAWVFLFYTQPAVTYKTCFIHFCNAGFLILDFAFYDAGFWILDNDSYICGILTFEIDKIVDFDKIFNFKMGVVISRHWWRYAVWRPWWRHWWCHI